MLCYRTVSLQETEQTRLKDRMVVETSANAVTAFGIAIKRHSLHL